MGTKPLRPPMRGGLRRTLVGAIVSALGGLVLASLLVGDPLVHYRVRSLAGQRMELALDAVGDALAHGDPPEQVAERYGAELGYQITVFQDEQPVGDSALDGEAMRRLAYPAEVVGEGLVTDAEGHFMRARDTGAGRVVFVRLARTNAALFSGIVHELQILVAIGAVLIAMLLSLVLGRTLVRPARRLTDVAHALADGDLSARSRTKRVDELGSIGRALDRMAVELDDRLARLSQEQDRLRTILDAMVEAVFVTDSLGRIQLTNTAFDELVREDVHGRTPMEALRSKELHDAVRVARRGGARVVDFAVDLRAPSEPGQPIPVAEARSFSAQVARLPGSQAVVAVLHDVTRLKETDAIRRDFVANASHELRTPLTAIRGFAETLRDGAVDDPEAAKRFLDVILKHTYRLTALVNDLAALSKAESPELAMNLLEVDADAVVVEVLRGLTAKADERRVQLIFEPMTDAPTVLADERALDQVMVNLVHNAIKYTPEASSVRVSSRPLGEEKLRIEVHNPGPGIGAEHQRRLFERFYRIDEGRSRDVGGTGLGLAIVKHLCQRMGATVGVESEPEKGATFYAELPLFVDETQQIAKAEIEAAEAAGGSA